MNLGIFIFMVLVIIGPAIIVAKIAQRKGYTVSLWFLYGLLIWPAALMHLLVISDIEQAIKRVAHPEWVHPCPNCTAMIWRHAQACPALLSTSCHNETPRHLY